MIGDCSEKARLDCDMAKNKGILARQVYGYVNGVERYAHAWCEYRIAGKWINHQDQYFDSYKKIGYGVT